MPFSVVRDEIARQKADVVVIPANTHLYIDGGAALAVARIAGLGELQAACSEIGRVGVGHAAATPAFAFPAHYFVHVVGPIWDASSEARAKLKQAYTSALALAIELGARSIALPLISAGVHGCPASDSLHAALEVTRTFLRDNGDIDIRIVLFSEEATRAGRVRFPDLAQYIDDAYVSSRVDRLDARDIGAARRYEGESRRSGFGRYYDDAVATFSGEELEGNVEKGADYAERFVSAAQPVASPNPLPSSSCKKQGPSLPSIKQLFQRRQRDSEKTALPKAGSAPTRDADAAYGQASNLGDWLDSIDASFSTTLLAIIDERGLTDAEVYHRANISRQHFSKIRSNSSYQPTKKTVLALAVALELDLDETRDLLERAGFALSHASKFDIIVEWFIAKGDYDIFEINEALYSFDQPILG